MNAGGAPNTCKSSGLDDSLLSEKLAADEWGTRKNQPLGGGQQLETIANTPYAAEWKVKTT